MRIAMDVGTSRSGKKYDVDPRLKARSVDADLRLNLIAKEFETGPGRLLLGTDKDMAPDTCDFCNAPTYKKKKVKLTDFRKFEAKYCQFHWKKYDKGRGDPRHDYDPIAYEDSEGYQRK